METPKDNDKNGQQENKDIKWTQRGLYAKEEPDELQARRKELKRLGLARNPDANKEEQEDTVSATKYRNLNLQRAKRWGKIVSFGGLLILVIAIVVGIVSAIMWYRSSMTVTEEQVDLTIDAPIEFAAGEEIIYRIKYQNNSRVDWQDVEIVFHPPRGFDYRGSNQEITQSTNNISYQVGDLNSGQAGELHLRGQLIGEQNETARAKADILVTPTNFPGGRFLKSTILTTSITAQSLEVGLDIPTDAAPGERIAGRINVRNLSKNTLDNVYLNINSSKGIELAVQDSDFSSNFNEVAGEWRIGSLPPLEDRSFTIIFFLDGQPGETRTMDIKAGIQQDEDKFTQRELTHILTISTTEVLVEQSYNKSTGPLTVEAGETIQGEVNYHNISTVGLRDAIVKVKFSGVAFNPTSLDLKGGSYNSDEETITWTAASYPELTVVQPRQKGSIPFSFKVKSTDQYPTSGEGAKNNVIISVATIDSPDIPKPQGGQKKVISDRSVLSVQTDINLSINAFYDDGRLGITSSGPVPPQVGESTTYTLRFRVGSTLNDASNVKISAVLPDGVNYTGESYKTDGEITFNDRTGYLTWKIPFVEGGVGRTTPPKELHFQVEIKPGEQLIGSEVVFLNQASIQATDQFVDQNITKNIESFPSTSTAVDGKGKVQ